MGLSDKTPAPSAGNPGRGPTAKVGFSNSQRSWEEYADLVEILAGVLAGRGHDCTRHEHWVQMGEYQFQPQLVAVIPEEDGGVQTSSTIEVSHARLLPTSLFEYQHATGDDVEQSFRSGFEGWTESDLPVFVDLENAEPETCAELAIELPATEESAPLSRRVLLGPPVQYCQSVNEIAQEHPFCPCCLVTNNFEALSQYINGTGVHGIRLFALRDQNGKAAADCRVDGLDYDDGAQSLAGYAGTWPDCGYEFRKQYVLVHNAAPGDDGR